MTKMQPINQQEKCPSCGAPIVSEICSYCGSPTGLVTAEADMEYPVLECKEASLGFWNVWFPAIFAVAFSFAGIMTFMITLMSGEAFGVAFIGLPFLLIGIAATFFVVRAFFRNAKVKKNGKMITATVYGYMDDNVLINGQPAQVVKLLVQTPGGPRFILYKLGNTLRPYGINDTLDIMVHENCFMIVNKKEVVNW